MGLQYVQQPLGKYRGSVVKGKRDTGHSPTVDIVRLDENFYGGFWFGCPCDRGRRGINNGCGWRDVGWCYRGDCRLFHRNAQHFGHFWLQDVGQQGNWQRYLDNAIRSVARLIFVKADAELTIVLEKDRVEIIFRRFRSRPHALKSALQPFISGILRFKC